LSLRIAFHAARSGSWWLKVCVEGYRKNGGTQVTMNCFNGDPNPGLADDAVRALFVAEFVEVLMSYNDINKNEVTWGPRYSNGEGLSHVLAALFYGDAYYQKLGGPFVNDWMTQGRPDWISKTEHTDGNSLSFGCAIVFIYYLISQLNYSIAAIVANGGATLAETYKNLTGLNFGPFASLLAANFSATTVLPTDNPFPLPAIAEDRNSRSAAVALAHQMSMNQLDAFEVVDDGALVVWWVIGDSNWSGPMALSQRHFAPPGARIALAHQVSMNQLDAVLVGNDGAISVGWVVGDGVWQSPIPMTNAGLAPPGAGIALAHQVSMNQLDAVFVGGDGAVSVIWVVGDGNWSGPNQITETGLAFPGGSVAVAHQVSIDQLS
jgi:hypothetical protein